MQGQKEVPFGDDKQERQLQKQQQDWVGRSYIPIHVAIKTTTWMGTPIVWDGSGRQATTKASAKQKEIPTG
jgi:hypothetical protein